MRLLKLLSCVGWGVFSCVFLVHQWGSGCADHYAGEVWLSEWGRFSCCEIVNVRVMVLLWGLIVLSHLPIRSNCRRLVPAGSLTLLRECGVGLSPV